MNSQNELALSSAAQAVPVSYAEKAMASLMQLHSELMDEKERRVDLFRRLMEKEQALAELKMYVKLLEEKAAAAVAPAPREPLKVAPRPPPAPSPAAVPAPPAVPFVARTAPAVRAAPAPYTRPLTSRPVPDGWKTW